MPEQKNINDDIPGPDYERQLTEHRVGTLNDHITIFCDAPGAGGASHNYYIRLNGMDFEFVRFQHGHLDEVGLNGISNETLLVILIDRLRGFDKGEFRCRENSIALTHLEDALHWLQHRTRDRQRRGVEGTYQK